MKPSAADLEPEVDIVWEEPIENLDYVREITVTTRTWDGPVPAPRSTERRVGYAVHERPENPRRGDRYTRRVFHLMPGDRDIERENGGLDPDDVYANWAPGEAVDPRTVKPGVPGKVTERVHPLDGDGTEEE